MAEGVREVNDLLLAAAPLVGVVLTLIFMNRREEARLRQERFFKFREDRTHLYVALARDTQYLTCDDETSNRVLDLYNEIRLLSEDESLVLAAERLKGAWDIACVKESERLETERSVIPNEYIGNESIARAVERLDEAKTRFIQAARTELGHSTTPAAQVATQSPWWRRMFGR